MMKVKPILIVVLFLIPVTTVFSESEKNYAFKEEGYGYIKSDTVWCSSSGIVTKKIYVCWENPSNDLKERKLVEKVVKGQWGKHSNLEFVGWGKCSNNIGIRILIDDSGPHVKGLGRKLNKKPNGMVLNFTFKNWGGKTSSGELTSCRSTEQGRMQCIKSIAVHEFGHAIGFAHEHNRADRPGECKKPSQGSNGDKTLTPYDPKSVMNYCNSKYNNNGELSKLDIQSINKVYAGENTYGFCN